MDIKEIINKEFNTPPPEERAALKLFKAGIKEKDLFIPDLEDTRRVLTQNALRDLERNFKRKSELNFKV